ncbi:MAG: hypothetical protein ACRD4K_11590 [Candidatus Acidiferrales bacterium]
MRRGITEDRSHTLHYAVTASYSGVHFQSAYEWKAVSVAGETVKVKDEVKIELQIVLSQ